MWEHSWVTGKRAIHEPVAAADRGPALDWMFTMEIEDGLAALGRRDPECSRR